MSEEIQKSEKLKNLEQKREKYITRIFWMMFEIALIFAIPAGAGVLLIRVLNISGVLIFVVLVSLFTLSWFFVIFRYRVIKNKLESLDKEILETREEEGIISNYEFFEEEHYE